MKEVNIALFGFGRIGRIHFQDIRHHMRHADVKVVVDPFYDAEKFKGENPGVEFYNSHEGVMSRSDIDAVLICTPTNSHAELILEAVKNNKHIFCEKPLDLSLDRSIKIAEIVHQSPVKMMVGFNRRFDKDFLNAFHSVREGALGDVQIVKITSRDPGLPPIDYIKASGGLFMDMAIHDFDMARYIMGKKIVEVFARGAAIIDKSVADAGDIDTALTTLIFEDGTYAVIDNSREASYGYDQRLEVFGRKGMIQVGNNLHNQNVLFDKDGIHKALPLDFFMDRYANSYLKEIELFINCLLNDSEVPAGIDDGLEAIRIAYAAQKSLETGDIVKL